MALAFMPAPFFLPTAQGRPSAAASFLPHVADSQFLSRWYLHHGSAKIKRSLLVGE
jgi:hypothetical protein